MLYSDITIITKVNSILNEKLMKICQFENQKNNFCFSFTQYFTTLYCALYKYNKLPNSNCKWDPLSVISNLSSNSTWTKRAGLEQTPHLLNCADKLRWPEPSVPNLLPTSNSNNNENQTDHKLKSYNKSRNLQKNRVFRQREEMLHYIRQSSSRYIKRLLKICGIIGIGVLSTMPLKLRIGWMSSLLLGSLSWSVLIWLSFLSMRNLKLSKLIRLIIVMIWRGKESLVFIWLMELSSELLGLEKVRNKSTKKYRRIYINNLYPTT